MHYINYGVRIFLLSSKCDEFQWNELMSEKPNSEYEDPVELAAIQDAVERMGDYKLKSADDYTVPDHLHMNIDKARSRLLVLKEKVGFSSQIVFVNNYHEHTIKTYHLFS